MHAAHAVELRGLTGILVLTGNLGAAQSGPADEMKLMWGKSGLIWMIGHDHSDVSHQAEQVSPASCQHAKHALQLDSGLQTHAMTDDHLRPIHCPSAADHLCLSGKKEMRMQQQHL